MESQLVTLNPRHVQTALTMTQVAVDINTAGVILDVFNSLLEKGCEYSLEDAFNILKKRYEPEEITDDNAKLIELNAKHRVLSELHDPKSKSKLGMQISEQLSDVLFEINQTVKKVQNG